MPKVKSSLRTRAENLLDQNHRVGPGFDYTCPSPRNYPHQWLWDSSFHAIVLSNLDPGRAKAEINTLLSKQREDGFVSCVNIWQKRFPFEELFYITKITQPPAIPIAVEKIYERTKDVTFVQEVYPKLKKFMHWLVENRDQNGNGLIEIAHPWEAGCDSIPSFDKQLGIKDAKPGVIENFYALFRVLYGGKRFVNENILFNSVYAKALVSMERLAEILGKKEDRKLFSIRFLKTSSALIGLCWSDQDQIFYDLDEHGNQISVKSISSLMPLILPGLPLNIYKPLVENHLLNEAEFWTPVPVASVPLDEPSFNPNRSPILWRGPMWINTNWFLAKGLRDYGYKKEAGELVEKTAETISKNGFWEFYNPLTGEGYGQPNLGWSTLVVDMLSFI